MKRQTVTCEMRADVALNCCLAFQEPSDYIGKTLFVKKNFCNVQLHTHNQSSIGFLIERKCLEEQTSFIMELLMSFKSIRPTSCLASDRHSQVMKRWMVASSTMVLSIAGIIVDINGVLPKKQTRCQNQCRLIIITMVGSVSVQECGDTYKSAQGLCCHTGRKNNHTWQWNQLQNVEGNHSKWFTLHVTIKKNLR